MVYRTKEYLLIEKVDNDYGIFEIYSSEYMMHIKVYDDNHLELPFGAYMPRFIGINNEVYLTIGFSD